MKCPKCQYENSAIAKFCVKCGCKLETVTPGPAAQGGQACSKCGTAIKPGAKFCTKCGSPVDANKTEEGTMYLFGSQKNDNDDRTMILNTGNGSSVPVQTPPQPVILDQDDIVPPVRGQAEKKKGKKEKEKSEKSGVGLIIAVVILGVAAIAGIVMALLIYLGSKNPKPNPMNRVEKPAEIESSEIDPSEIGYPAIDADPMQELLENGQYTDLIDALLAMDDLDFYGDEDNMREYMGQALAGHMNAAKSEAEGLASSGDFEGAYGKIDAEIAYRNNLKGQGRVYPLTEDSSELEAEKDQITTWYISYVDQHTRTMAEQRDLAGMESLLGQASGRLPEAEYNRISIDAYYMYVIRMVDQMQAENKDPYEIMSFIDSYFEKTNYHGYMMELWDNQNAQSGRVGTWRTAVTHQDSNGYLLYNSDGRYINKSELGNFTQYELYLARWEIYARHNRKFVDSALNTYFSKYSWYNADESKNFQVFDDSILNEYEKGNIKTIIDYEKECGYR